MSRPLYHPERDQISLPAVLDAMSDPTRLAIVLYLDRVGESVCGALTPWASKTSLSYHFARLREAGITQSRIEGTYRRISLRRDDLEARFPGLLPQLIDAAKQDPAIAALEDMVAHQDGPAAEPRRKAARPRAK
ncbi:MAG TPA: helix-turn-helix transcriptional regulator [Ferrovibrio sp.]|uniref:ArsR/SmtB family transcription factor n=1 Tax=Ferrovibrio sp. TaxID=1917215 RepID=UPI002ED22DB4